MIKRGLNSNFYETYYYLNARQLSKNYELFNNINKVITYKKHVKGMFLWALWVRYEYFLNLSVEERNNFNNIYYFKVVKKSIWKVGSFEDKLTILYDTFFGFTTH